ncbi:MFS transporter [Minwuia sp.]|uniref:MFS transporter n=1 Tax=Minwuia sp. TaxID=2493630 RepID=UPI003A92DF5A
MTAATPEKLSPTVKRNVILLALCQGLGVSTFSIMIAIGPLIGYSLAIDKALSTLPVTAVVTGTAIATIPAAMFMGRFGRRPGFLVGAGLGLAGSAVGAYALIEASFWLYCIATALVGMFSAFVQQYRHAAVDVSPVYFRPRAVSYVMAGGLLAGFLGPEIAKHTEDLIPTALFLGCFVGTAGLAAITALVVIFLDIPPLARQTRETRGRPMREIMKNPVFWVAVFSGMIGFGVMSLIMTATPLAMKLCGFSFEDSTTVIQWHVVGMYLPAFFTGSLIIRFGVLRIIVVGAILNLICVGFAITGIEMLNFWTALVLLGVGWNFMFVGGTTLLAECYTPAEAPRVQGMNDFLVFGVVALSSLSSGQLLDRIGWDAVALTAVPLVSIAMMGALWLMFSRFKPQRA